MIGPARLAIRPSGRPGQVWKPKICTGSIGSNSPSAIIASAPRPVSSAG